MSIIPSGLLRTGSHGKLVSDLQRELAQAGFSPGGIDGTFGPKTRAALIAFQRAKHLSADGVAGRQTWTALGGDRFESSGGSGPAQVGGGSTAGGKQVTAYSNGRASTITVVPVGNGQFMRADAAGHFKAMVAAAAHAGIHLSATSGFRSMAQQQYLYDGWIHHRPGFNLAARPGYSNHQNGIAMDIGGIGGYGTTAYRWLTANAGRFGFKNDVGGEFWHFDYRG